MINNKHMDTFQKTFLKGAGVLALAVALLGGYSGAQGAGNKIGVDKGQIKTISQGWSIKDSVMGKAVYNENNEKIGTIDDIVVTQNKWTPYAIIGVGGFLGMGKHDVAIAMSDLKLNTGKEGYLLRGATKETLKAMPEYAKA